MFELGRLFCELWDRIRYHTLELSCASNASKMTKCELCGYAQPSLSWDKFHHIAEKDFTFVLSSFFVLSVQFVYLWAKYLKSIYSFGKRKISNFVETVQFIFSV